MGMYAGYKQTPEHIKNRFDARAGWKHSEETKKLLSKNAYIRKWTKGDRERHSELVKKWHREHPRMGEDSPNFVGIQKRRDYVSLYCPDHPYADHSGYVREHRIVMERQLGRLLEKGEIVHHKDGDKTNNNPGNLLLTTRQEHQLGMGSMYKRGYDMGFAAAFILFSKMGINRSN